MRNYVQAESLKEAYDLRQKSKNNVILGGNLWMKMGNRQIQNGIDLANLGLDQMEETEEEYRIGCMCTLRDLETNLSLHKEFNGSMKEALRHIVGVQFRNTATVGGSLYPRFGFSDVLTIFGALDAYVELYGGGLVPIRKFVEDNPAQDILVRIIVKKDKRAVSYQSHRMTETDFAVLTCAVAKKEDNYSVVFGARPQKAKIVDDIQLPASYTEEELSACIENVVNQVSFGSNMRGSGQYRKAMAKVLMRRAFEELNA